MSRSIGASEPRRGTFFNRPTGQNAYGFEHSLLRIGIGQKSEAFEWFLEGAADAIFDLPPSAVQPGRLGQLGLGGTYYAANGNVRNTCQRISEASICRIQTSAEGQRAAGPLHVSRWLRKRIRRIRPSRL